VLGRLLIEGVEAHKVDTNYPGYDVEAVNPETGRRCRIQVRSRWATDYNRTFPIKHFDCEFVVLAALNRGFRYGRRVSADDGRREPEFYVFPIDVVSRARKRESRWGTVPLSSIGDLDEYRNAWWRVREYLAKPTTD
jgi:hypothetical protein